MFSWLDTSFLRYLLALPFQPLPCFWLLLAAAFLFYRRRKERTARWLGGAALGWLLLISTGPVPHWLVSTLEDRYPPLTEPEVPAGDTVFYIVVLGAGHTDNPVLPATGRLSPGVLGRLVEGVRLQKRVPGSVLVTSGRRGEKSTQSQAAAVRRAALELGVPPERTDTLSFTTNTRDEAFHFRERFGTAARLILVTDAVHLPRAMLWFRKAGLDPIPAPTNFILKDPPGEREIGLIPNSGHIEKMEKAVHEYLGRVWLGMRDEG